MSNVLKLIEPPIILNIDHERYRVKRSITIGMWASWDAYCLEQKRRNYLKYGMELNMPKEQLLKEVMDIRLEEKEYPDPNKTGTSKKVSESALLVDTMEGQLYMFWQRLNYYDPEITYERASRLFTTDVIVELRLAELPEDENKNPTTPPESQSPAA